MGNLLIFTEKQRRPFDSYTLFDKLFLDRVDDDQHLKVSKLFEALEELKKIG